MLCASANCRSCPIASVYNAEPSAIFPCSARTLTSAVCTCESPGPWKRATGADQLVRILAVKDCPSGEPDLIEIPHSVVPRGRLTAVSNQQFHAAASATTIANAMRASRRESVERLDMDACEMESLTSLPVAPFRILHRPDGAACVFAKGSRPRFGLRSVAKSSISSHRLTSNGCGDSGSNPVREDIRQH